MGADLKVMDRDARKMRGSGPTVFAQVKNGVGMDEIVKNINSALAASKGGAAAEEPPAKKAKSKK